MSWFGKVADHTGELQDFVHLNPTSLSEQTFLCSQSFRMHLLTPPQKSVTYSISTEAPSRPQVFTHESHICSPTPTAAEGLEQMAIPLL